MGPPSRSTSERWNQQLRYFRFTYAHGGHANDMDTLSAEIRFSDEESLLAIFDRLGAPLERFAEDEPRLVVGQTYRGDEIAGRVYPITGFPNLKPPTKMSIDGMPVFAMVGGGRVLIIAAGADGNAWDVTENDFRNALRLEDLFDRVGLRPILPTSPT